MEMLVTVIALWLTANFGLQISHEHPRIEFHSAGALSRLWAARLSSSDRLTLGSSGNTLEFVKIHAYYDDETETIILTDDWSAESPADVSILVHEMVHHLQNSDERVFPCPAAREKLAYQAQEQWLALFGSSLESEFGIDRLTFLVKTQCMH